MGVQVSKIGWALSSSDGAFLINVVNTRRGIKPWKEVRRAYEIFPTSS